MIKVLEGSVFSFTCSSLGGKPPGIVRQDIAINFMPKGTVSQVDHFGNMLTLFYRKAHQNCGL